jgi:periplasmic protein CpxP/Spy
MKKIVSILVLVLAFTLTTQAQKKRKDQKPKLSVEQQADLAVKKMTLALDLSKKQQNQIAPLIKAQASERKAAMEKRKKARINEEKPTADEMYAMQSKRLDNQIVFKNKMKEILDATQFEEFEKMAKRRMQKGKQMKEKGAQKKRRMSREEK